MKKIFFMLMVSVMGLNSSELKINYQRINEDYDGWKLWVWDKTENKHGFEILPQGKNDFGIFFILDLDKYNLKYKEIGLLPKYGSWENKEAFDRVFKHNGESEIYIIEDDTNVYLSLKDIEVSTKITGAFYDDGLLRITLNRRIYTKNLSNYDFYLLNTKTAERKKLEADKNSNISKYLFFRSEIIDLEEIRQGNYKIESDFGDTFLSFGNSMYSIPPTDEKLGEIFYDNKIILRTFSLAKELRLIIKKNENEKEELIPFNYKGNFIWEIILSTDYYNSFYRYEALYPDKILYGIDPYAALTYDNNKWAILKKDETPVIEGPKFDISETIIYEMNIRDFTIDEYSGVKNKGKYLGLTQEKTYHPLYPDILTGISHLKELGINTVHIMPFYDFEKNENTEDYDWGYMPVSFNSPDGWFAVNKKEKIKEVKEMINTLHKNGIKVIMDVVYNHTAETKDKIYNFNALAYDYYYRRKPDNSYYNGSGCGNEFKSESPYGRKFLIDSLKYWVNEYKIDGFRFDLMGLIDLETVDEIIKELKKIKPDIIIYGEPWHAGGTPIEGVKKGTQKGKGYAVFNDELRDGLKGSVFHLEDLGYVQTGNYRDKVMKGIRGSVDLFTDSPLETINYVSCHDNHTLFDRLYFSTKEPEMNVIVKQNKLAQAIVFVSQGIPFLHSGEEFLRTKKGNENSYNAGDEINKIDWTRKKDFYDIFSYYKDLIKLKKEHPAFRMKTKKEVIENIKFYEELGLPIKEPQIAFMIYGEKVNDPWGNILVLINPERKIKKFELPDGKWKVEFDENGFAKETKNFSKEIYLPPISLYILSKN